MIIHGHSPKNYKSPTYRAWRAMMQRCYRPRQNGFERYGGRGIAVCERWHQFTNFLADMGEKPDGMTLDRIDADSNYGPQNCRWASWKYQARNKSSTVFLTFNGERRSITAFVGVSLWDGLLGSGSVCRQRRAKRNGRALSSRCLTTKLQLVRRMPCLNEIH